MTASTDRADSGRRESCPLISVSVIPLHPCWSAVRHNEMVLGVEGGLDVVAHDPRVDR